MSRPRGLNAREVILYYAREDSNGCWRWCASINKSGYSQVWFEGKLVGTHRLSYEAFVGSIDSDKEIDHICRVRDCVSPFHLRQLTPKENTLCGFGISAINAKKTHCLRGHKYDEVNTYWDKSGHRYCLACNRVASREYQRRRRRLEKSNVTASGGVLPC